MLYKIVHLQSTGRKCCRHFSLPNLYSKAGIGVRRVIKLKKGRGEEEEFRKERLIWVRLTELFITQFSLTPYSRFSTLHLDITLPDWCLHD
jgi:hypothetical protein